jgi:hypothetical protein
VDATVDDPLGPFSRGEAAKVRQSLFSDDHVDVILGVVNVGDHGNDARQHAALAVEGVTNAEMYALRAKSPEPPMPFWMADPIT